MKRKLISMLMALVMILSLVQVLPVSAASYTVGYEEDFNNLLNWKLSESTAISLKNGAIVTSGSNVPTAYLKGNFAKWDKYVFTTEISRTFKSGTWIRIYLGGFSLLIKQGSVSFLRDGETENSLGAFKQESDKRYKIKVERDEDTAKVYMMASDDNRYTEIGTITNLANGSNYGVSSLNIAATFHSFKFESKTKSPITFDKAYYDIIIII